MKVCWVTRFSIDRRDGQPYSIHAAVRLRTIIPVQALQQLGHAASIVSLDHSFQPRAIAELESFQAAVFDQTYPFGGEQLDQSGTAHLELIARLRHAGVKTVADIHDNHFELPGRMDYFHQLVQRVDLIAVNTPGMKNIVSGHTRRPIEVIGDPYEGPHGEPSFTPATRRGWGRLLRGLVPWGNSPRLKLAWFGHPSNFAALYELMPQLLPVAKRTPVKLTVVCAENSGIEEACALLNNRHGRHCRIVFVPWSLEATWTALCDCDMCVIPVDVASGFKAAKSANRLVETLRAGRFAVASPLAAYQELSSCAMIEEDVPQGIRWALDHPAEVLGRIRAGQLAVERNYSPAAIAKRWEQMLVKLTA